MLWLFIVGMGTSSALTLSFNALEQTRVHENYSLTLQISDAEPSQTYDVKIMMKETGRENLSQIFVEGAWKSTFYYLKAAYPALVTFTLLPQQASEKAEVCVRLRKTGSKSFIEYCQNIRIEPLSSPLPSLPTAPSPIQPERSLNTSTVHREVAIEPRVVPLASPSVPPSILQEEPLKLNAPLHYRASSAPLYYSGIFTTLIILILVLLGLRKI